MYNKPLLVLILVGLSMKAHADTFVRDDLVLPPRPERFSICYHGTCADKTEVSLTPRQWQSIRDFFSTTSSPDEERESIRLAIAQMERMVGIMTGTSVDKAGTFEHMGEPGQLDCIDEATNTSFYIQMMIDDKLIHWHQLEDRATRGYFLNGAWPHNTAVIRDRQSNALYAVDSWFRDNGLPPYIIPLSQWQDGWEPPSN